ncbi:MAG: hypothetical protein MR357_01875, partial [Anaeroplasma sp.]|nr:hypothetical protein [Anaeroplasma sp.]
MKTNLSLILGLGSIQLVITYIVIFVVLIILLIVFFVLYGGQKGASIASSDKKIDENNRYVDAKLKKKTSTSRFYQLTQQDKKMENYKAPEYNTKIELDE